MQEIGDRSATLARHSNSGFSHLLWGCIEGGLHPGAGGRCLHPGDKGIEFTTQSIELDSVGVSESIELAHRNQKRFRLVVFSDDDYAALNRLFQGSAELILRIRGCNSGRGAQPVIAIGTENRRLIIHNENTSLGHGIAPL